MHNRKIPALNEANPRSLGRILRILASTDLTLSSRSLSVAAENFTNPLCSNEKPSSHKKATVKTMTNPGKLSARLKKLQSKTIFLPVKENRELSKRAISGTVNKEKATFIRTMKVTDFEGIFRKT